MAARTLLVAAALLGPVAGLVQEIQQQVNPIRKVVGLLQNLQSEIEDEGAKEKVLFDKFMCFCDAGSGDLLKTANDAKMQNKAATAKLESDAAEKAQLEADIKQHEKDLAAATADLEEATNVRNQAKAEFDATSGTKSASDAALAKAIPAIEKGLGGGASAFMQVDNPSLVKQLKRALRSSQSMTDGSRKEVMAFLEGQTPGSAEIVGMLKSMKDELTRDLSELRKTEEAQIKGFNGMKASKENEIEFADESIESKKERVGSLAVEIVQLQDEIEDSAAEAADAEKFAATLDQQCASKKTEWAERSKMRSDEIAAVGQAIAILNDDDALDVFKKAIPAAAMLQGGHVNRFTGELTLLQAGAGRKPAMLLQKAQAIISDIESNSARPIGLFLLGLKSKMNLAAQNAGAVDFNEISKMIEEMVVILSNEQKDDAKQKDFCIAELTKTEKEKAGADDKMASLTSQIEELGDAIAQSEEKIKALTEGVAALDKDVAEATDVRKSEHSAYTANLQLSETAIALLGKAKNVLHKFYNPSQYKAPPKKEMTMEEKIIASGSSALMQSEANFDTPEVPFSLLAIHRSTRVAPPQAPETFSGFYQKNQKSGGVLALMDMITNELKASLQEARFAEKTAQKEYVELMADSQAKRDQDGKSLVNENAAKADLESSVIEAKERQHLTLAQLENLHSTLARLHGSCDFLLKNFELRLNARTAEIEGLKTAKAVLAGASFS